MNTQARWTIPRKRILDTLRSAVLSHPLVVLTAPVGYGKTIIAHDLVRSFATKQKRNRSSTTFTHPYYLPLYQGECSSSYLWERHYTILSSLGSPLAPVMRRTYFPFTVVQRPKAVEDARAITAHEPHLFVLDDYHFLRSPDYDLYLERLARAAIPGFSVLLLSRSRPNLPLEELRVKGLCAVFDKELLKFTETEAVRFFQACGIQDQRVAKDACAISEGWAAALWLNSQQYLSHGVLAPKKDFHQILRHAVFSEHSNEDQLLLLKLSILDSFTPEQASMISEERGVAQRLAFLCAHNAFVHYRPEVNRYRMHSLFHSFCVELFDALTADVCDKAALYRRAAEWSLQQDDPVGAIYTLKKADRDEDLERILELYERPYSRGIMDIDRQGMTEIVSNIPWRIRLRRPIGYISFIFSYAFKVDLAHGLQLLREVEERFSGGEFSREQAEHVQGHILFIRGILVFNDLRQAFSLMREAGQLLQEPVAISSKHLLSTYGSPHLGFLYHRNEGDYEALVAEGEEGWQPYFTLSLGCALGSPTLMRAEHLLETGQFEQAGLKAEQSIAEAELQEHIPVLLGAYFSLSRLYMATKRVKEALAALEEMARQAKRSSHTMVPGVVEIAQGYIHACLGKAETVPAWLVKGKLDTATLRYHGMYFSYIVQGKTLLLREDYVKLLGLTQFMRQEYSRRNFFLGVLHALVLESIATWNVYGPEKAVPIFTKAMGYARADGLVLIPAEYGEALLPLLNLWIKGNPDDDFARRVRQQTAVYTDMSEVNLCKNAHTVKLTDRERRMLGFVAQGKSNTQIAKLFGVQPVTVTKALGNAYRKLGVKNRSQAVHMLKK